MAGDPRPRPRFAAAGGFTPQAMNLSPLRGSVYFQRFHLAPYRLSGPNNHRGSESTESSTEKISLVVSGTRSRCCNGCPTNHPAPTMGDPLCPSLCPLCLCGSDYSESLQGIGLRCVGAGYIPPCVSPRGVTHVLIRFCYRSPDTEQLTPQAKNMPRLRRSNQGVTPEGLHGDSSSGANLFHLVSWILDLGSCALYLASCIWNRTTSASNPVQRQIPR